MRIPDPLQWPVQPSAQSGAAFMGTGESIPVLIVNTDANNTIYAGYRNQSTVGDANTAPIGPGQSVVMDGARTIYVIGPKGTANATIIPGGSAFFQPTSLNTLGGIKVFIQASAPTQPPTIPVNSIWLQTSAGNVIAFSTWNGSAWVQQQFNAQGLLVIGTIVANLIATGTIVAGIVDGTTITGGILRAKNSFGATILTVNKSTGTWLLYADTGSATQGALVASAAQAAGTDEFTNAFKAGVNAYGTGGSTSYVQLLPGNPVNVNVATGDAAEQAPGDISAIVSGSGASRSLAVRVKSPLVSAFPNGSSRIDLFPPAVDNSSPSEIHTQVIDADGVTGTSLFQTPTGFNFSGPITSTTGTATKPTLITTDIWETYTLINSFTGTLNYRLCSDGTVEIYGSVTTPAAGFNFTNINNAPLSQYGAFQTPAINPPILCYDNNAGSIVLAKVFGNGQIQFVNAVASHLIVFNGRYPAS